MADEKKWTKEEIRSRIDENELDLSLCGISKVPVKSLLSFTKITVLDLSCNKINVLPDSFCKLVSLVQLDLSKNALTELPENFGLLIRLKKLDLLQNHLTDLPISICNLKQLQWLDLKENPIQESLPDVVGDCLKAKECNQCANNVLEYYENLFNEELEKERKTKKREDARLAKVKREQEALRQRKKEERKKRTQEEQKQNELINNAKNENLDVANGNHGKEKLLKEDKQTSSSCFRILFYLLMLCSASMILYCLIYQRDFKTMMSQLQQAYKYDKSHDTSNK